VLSCPSSSVVGVRIGVLILPEHRWETAVEKWLRAEALGFDHAWTYDHISWDRLRDSPWFGSVPLLAAVGVMTSRIRLGTLVASPNFRHPVPFAQELVTLDDLSRGRYTLGIGSGSQGSDATVLGNREWSLGERTDRLEEFVDLLDRLLRHRHVTYTGRFWSAVEAGTEPSCVQQPRIPFAIAATGPRSLRVAARHASTWVTNGDRSHTGPALDPEQGARVVAKQTRLLVEACEKEGRDPASIDRLVLTGSRLDSGLASRETFITATEAYASVGVTDLVVHWPRPNEPYAGDEEILEYIIT